MAMTMMASSVGCSVHLLVDILVENCWYMAYRSGDIDLNLIYLTGVMMVDDFSLFSRLFGVS